MYHNMKKFKHSVYVKVDSCIDDLYLYLKDLGYNKNVSDETIFISDIIYCRNNTIYSVENKDIELSDIDINCGSNIELFKAIAALNDFDDYKQYFYNNGEYLLCDDLCFNNNDDVSNYCDYDTELPDTHKLSVNELIIIFDGKC